jgi:hypothetical protein
MSKSIPEPKPGEEVEEGIVFEELEVAEIGTPIEAEIMDIMRGKCVEFPAVQRIRNEAIKQRWLERKDAECIQLVVKVNNATYTLFPVRVSNNPRSTFYRLLKKYGQKEGNIYRLKKGTKIKIVFTDRGFPRLYIPE